MSIVDDIINIQRKYFNNEDISVELSELLVKAKNGEFQNQASSTQKPTRIFVQNYEEVNKIAFYLSLYDHYKISQLKQPTLAIRELAEKLQVKPSTLRNKRDNFDPFISEKKEKLKNTKGFNNLKTRKGWVKANRNLPPQLQQTYDECINKSHDELLAEVKEILNLK